MMYLLSMLNPLVDLWKAIKNHPIWKGVVAILMSAADKLIDTHGAGFLLLLVLLAMDALTGVAVAIKTKAFTSKKFRNSGVKLLGYLLIIVAMHLLEELYAPIGRLPISIDVFAIFYFAATEALSILENVNRLTGVGAPPIIKAIIDKILNRK